MYKDEHMERYILFTLITVTVVVFLYQVKAICPDGCIACNPGGLQCSSCSKEYWLNSGKCDKCPDNCLECQLGRCTLCKVMFYNLEVNCANRCDLCDENGCDDDTGMCYSCRQGYYGEYCQNDCGHCINRQCSRQQCDLGCQLGYVLQTINNINNCFPCPANCNICLNTTFCTQCQNGYYANRFIGNNGYGYANCYACGTTSVCTQCQKISNCLQCGVSGGVLTCDICNDGFVSEGISCEHLKCSVGCYDKCDENGNCISGCKDGYTGTNCTYRCFEHCTKCMQTNPNICETCTDDYYTQSCNAKCNHSCKVIPEMPTCSINDGNCMNGCNRGFSGVQCQYTCSSNCFDNTSSQDICQNNGSCTYGCKPGFSGADCNERGTSSFTIFTPTDKATESIVHNAEDGRMLGAAIGGSIAGICVVTVVIVAAVVFYMRKRTQSGKRKQNQNVTTYCNMSMESTQEQQSNLDRSNAGPTTHNLSQPFGASLYEQLSDESRNDAYSQLDVRAIKENQATGKVQANTEYYNI